ncbi:MAG: integrase arm-type DNA-binding domain-containing protein [Methylovulum miyakonense]|jgi:integrase|uniref:tyrosine-type recombinase/integrase n=1 Tax=Methylovulum miyakonense TaxID=645578 RepID=UPI003BB78BCD
MSLNEVKVRNAKPKEKPYKLSDSEGLYLYITETGGKLWRFKYRFDNDGKGKKEKLLALGSYPGISLLNARQRRDDARKLLANNVDPGAVRKAQKQAKIEDTETFEVISREWHNKFKSTWTEGHALKLMRRLELDLFPWLGARPIKDITAPELLAVLRRTESRGAVDGAHRLRGICNMVFRYATATGRAQHNLAQDLIGSLPPAQKRHLAAITEPNEVANLLRAIDNYHGSFIVRCALRISPLVFVRPGELRHMQWDELDFEKAEWHIPAAKMKLRQPHIVPLSTQSIEILNEIKPLTGSGIYVFPGRTSSNPMSNNAILAALRNMGYTAEQMTPHGFRAMARTILDEVLQVRPDLIEHQLAHAVRDPLGRAYNRTQHLPERRKMMQTWADYLDGLKAGAKVIPFRTNA